MTLAEHDAIVKAFKLRDEAQAARRLADDAARAIAPALESDLKALPAGREYQVTGTNYAVRLDPSGRLAARKIGDLPTLDQLVKS